MGLVVPHVSTVAQAEAIAAAVRYPPRGHRSSGTSRATIDRGWTAQANDHLIICPQIEDLEGADNTEAIMAVDGMDVAYIGPSDLALSMGLTSADMFTNADHAAAIAKVLAGAQANGKPAGLPAPTVERARQLIAQGFTMLDYSSDYRILQAAVVEQLAAVLA